jgi:hypothetical protein
VGQGRLFGVGAKDDTGCLAEADGSKGGQDNGVAVSEELLRLVDIVDAPASATDVLGKERVDGVSPGPDAEDKRVLSVSLDCDMAGDWLTLALTGSSYSVFRWTRKCRTDCLCSCCSNP